MNRREFFRRATLLAAGVVAADQLELLEKLAHSKVWTGWSPDPRYFDLGFLITQEMIEDDIMYPRSAINEYAKGMMLDGSFLTNRRVLQCPRLPTLN